MKRWTTRIVPVVLLILTGIATACPMCKDSIPNSDAPNGGGLPSGFNSSVYLMLIAFLGTLALISGVIWNGVRTTNIQRGFPVEPRDDQNNV